MRKGNATGGPYRFTGVCETESFRLTGLGQREDGIVAELTVTSFHPYQHDAVRDLHRAAYDVCNLLSVTRGHGWVFEPLEGSTIEALEGAKEKLRIYSGAGASLLATGSFDAEERSLLVAERLDEHPSLRADLDTLRLAALETDPPTRLIHHARIIDSEMDLLRKAEPALLTDDASRDATRALIDALPENLSGKERARVESAVRDALARVRKRPRPEFLAAGLSKRLNRAVTPDQIRALDATRGKYAHGSTEMDAAPGEAEANLAEEVARALLERDALGE